MTFPFEFLSSNARETGLVVGLLIGIGFGFVLERAGFGDARKLSAQFYLRDMTVFKVMFTAIVTAMLGLVIASAVGLTNLRGISEQIASWTYVGPMIAGGLLLGAGFIISGYCPGTSVVSAASGHVDGLFAVGGVVTGTFVYSELMRIPRFAAFHQSGDKGAWFLYDLIKVPPQVLAAFIAVFALAMFVGAEKVESMFGTPRPPKRFAFATVAAIAVIALVTIAIPSFAPSAQARPRTIAAADVASMIASEPWRVRVVDTRTEAKDRIPGAEVIAADAVGELPDDGRTLVVVGDAKKLPPHALLLAGGAAAWTRDPLARAMATGAPPPSPARAAAPGTFAKPKKKGGGCSA